MPSLRDATRTASFANAKLMTQLKIPITIVTMQTNLDSTTMERMFGDFYQNELQLLIQHNLTFHIP
ncbi:hypothetical protein [uncultured Nostoc sp.]|uniref:hypothetical protein n=1 Tax=uncultured Nostoc sp. TaxID=340711 RepID=UPI0035CBD08D